MSVEIAQLSEKARTRKITLEEMQGGCFSISNLGGIGGTFFTPIVNSPEVAILGISRAQHGAGVRQGHRSVRAAPDAAAVAVLRPPRRSTAPTASASCAGSSRRSSSRSCWRCRDEATASRQAQARFRHRTERSMYAQLNSWSWRRSWRLRRRVSGRRSRSERGARRSRSRIRAASASTAAASRRRRCCTSPS